MLANSKTYSHLSSDLRDGFFPFGGRQDIHWHVVPEGIRAKFVSGTQTISSKANMLAFLFRYKSRHLRRDPCWHTHVSSEPSFTKYLFWYLFAISRDFPHFFCLFFVGVISFFCLCVFVYILFEGEEHAIGFALDQMALSKRAFTKYTKNLPDKRFGQCQGCEGKVVWGACGAQVGWESNVMDFCICCGLVHGVGWGVTNVTGCVCWSHGVCASHCLL